MQIYLKNYLFNAQTLDKYQHKGSVDSTDTNIVETSSLE